MTETTSLSLPKVTIGRAVVWTMALIAVLVMAITGADDVLPRVAAISALSVALFATRLLPEVATAIGTFLAFIAIGAAPNEVIFSGFASSGFWLLFAGLVIGTAITTTGLGMQVALRIFQRTGDSYIKAALLLALSGLGLGVLVPSTIPRIIIMVPIALALAKTMGYRMGSRGHIGLTVAAAVSTNLPTYTFLTGNLPTIIQMGAFETLYGVRTAYADYFIQHAPINIVRFLALLAVMLPYAPPKSDQMSSLDAPEPFTRVQKLLFVLICIAILFWVTDSLHGISPAWIALSLAAVLTIPAFGMLDDKAMKTQIDMSPAFFLAAVFAISAVAQFTGLSAAMADRLIPMLQLGQGSDLRDLYAVTGLSSFLSHFTTAPAAPAILAPLAEAMATGTGWAIETISMTQVLGISTPLLPHQAPPLIVSMALAQIPVSSLLRVCAWLALAVVIVGIPLTYLWWNVLGMFG